MMASRVTPLHEPKGADRIAWRRSRRRAWKRPDQSGSTAAVFALMPSLSRAELARLTHHMIDRMDEIDGDPDLEHLREDDEDGSDAEQEEAYE
jgi:hypothetical protein